jgi:hypothetical protein
MFLNKTPVPHKVKEGEHGEGFSKSKMYSFTATLIRAPFSLS